MKLRTLAELRAIAADATRDHRDLFQALYDAGRLDSVEAEAPIKTKAIARLHEAAKWVDVVEHASD